MTDLRRYRVLVHPAGRRTSVHQVEASSREVAKQRALKKYNETHEPVFHGQLVSYQVSRYFLVQPASRPEDRFMIFAETPAQAIDTLENEGWDVDCMLPGEVDVIVAVELTDPVEEPQS